MKSAYADYAVQLVNTAVAHLLLVLNLSLRLFSDGKTITYSWQHRLMYVDGIRYNLYFPLPSVFQYRQVLRELVRRLLHWISMGRAKTASGLSNHSPEPNHGCAHTTQLRICNSDSIVIVTLWALYAICV